MLRLLYSRVPNQPPSRDNQVGGTDRAGHQLSLCEQRNHNQRGKSKVLLRLKCEAEEQKEYTGNCQPLGWKKAARHEKEQHEEAGDAWEFQVLNAGKAEAASS